MSLRSNISGGNNSTLARMRALCASYRPHDAAKRQQHEVTTEEIAQLEYPLPVTSHRMLRQFFEESFKLMLERYRFRYPKHDGVLLASAKYSDRYNTLVFTVRLYNKLGIDVARVDVPVQTYVGTQNYNMPGYTFVPNMSWNEDWTSYVVRMFREHHGVLVDDTLRAPATAPCPSVISAVDVDADVSVAEAAFDLKSKQAALSALEEQVEEKLHAKLEAVMEEVDEEPVCVEVIAVSDDITVDREFVIGQRPPLREIEAKIDIAVLEAEQKMNEIDDAAQRLLAESDVVSVVDIVAAVPDVAPVIEYSAECLRDVHATDIAFKAVVRSVVKLIVVDTTTLASLDSQLVSDNVLLHLQEPGLIRGVFSTSMRPIWMAKVNDAASLEFQLQRCREALKCSELSVDDVKKLKERVTSITHDLEHLHDNERLFLQFDDSRADDAQRVRELDVHSSMLMLPIAVPQMLTLPTLRRRYDARLDRFVIQNMTAQHAETSPVVQAKLRLLTEKIRDSWAKVCGKTVPIDNGYTQYPD